jgi:hypothetical protein
MAAVVAAITAALGFRDVALAPVPREKHLRSSRELRVSIRENDRCRLVWQG